MVEKDYKIIIDTSVLSSPYYSRLEATRYYNGTWKVTIIYRTKNKSDLSMDKRIDNNQVISTLNDCIKKEEAKLQKLKENIEFLLERLDK